MNIKTLGQNLADLGDKLRREQELTSQARADLLQSTDVFFEGILESLEALKVKITDAKKSYRQSIDDEFGSRQSSLIEAIGDAGLGIAESAS